MAIANQGYRRDLNLSETENEEQAISNLMGTGIDADLRYLQNNLRNTSRIPFNKVDSAGFFSFDEDKTITIESLSSDKIFNQNNTRITVTLTEPYLLKAGNLVELTGISESGASILNGQYSVTAVSVDLKTIRLKKSNLVYENSSISISGVSFIHKAENIFTYTQDDVVNVSLQTTFTVGTSSTVLSPNTDYYVTDSNGINKFKLSYTPSDSISGVTTIAIPHSISSPTVLSTPSGASQFEFVRKDPVHRDQLLFFKYPEIQDTDDFSYLENGSINGTLVQTQSNIESAEYFTTKKYRGDKGLVSTDESIKYEGSVVLNDPQNYNSSSDDVLNVGVDGSPAPGIYIGGTRAFSSDNNPWGKEGTAGVVGSALTTSSEEVSIGELAFLDGSLLSSTEEGSMIIDGIDDDVSDVSVIANSFTHKVPIKIEDASGNQESYFLLVSDT
jgi:hypothetical protein